MKRSQKQMKYYDNYGHIPVDYNERLNWMFDQHKLSEAKCIEILEKRDQMMQNLQFADLNINLFEEPEGSKRSRFRVINRKNFASAAIANPSFVHVYTPDAASDNAHMKRMTEDGLVKLDQMICTPCIVQYKTYIRTPKVFSITDRFLAEIGLTRPIVKPDWDNMGKKYSDMSNANVWLDDSFVISGTVDKFYSILPRVEISIKYLNMVYNKYQYNSVTRRKDFNENNCEVEYFEYSKGGNNNV